MITIDKILRSLKHLQPFPAAAQNALGLLMDPEVPAGKVMEQIQYDQALTANVLRMCNSAYFGLSGKIHSLKNALMRIGNKNMRVVLMASGLMQFYTQGSNGYKMRKEEIWRHSVACGMIANILGSFIIKKSRCTLDAQTLFTAALLHDIGKVILNEYAGEEFEQIMTMVESQGHSFVEAERQIIGMDHTALGAQICTIWKFPGEIANAIAFHHSPESFPDALTSAVNLTDLFCLMKGIGLGAESLAPRSKEQVVQRHGLSEQDIEKCMASVTAEMERSAELLSFGSGGW